MAIQERFKIGDEVIVNNDGRAKAQVGTIGKITRTYNARGHMGFQYYMLNDQGAWMKDDWLDPATEEQKERIRLEQEAEKKKQEELAKKEREMLEKAQKTHIREHLQFKVEKNGSSGTCSFAIRYKLPNGKVRDSVHCPGPCSAALGYKQEEDGKNLEVLEVAYNLSGHYNYLKKDRPDYSDAFLDAARYVLNRSPWRDAFITKRIDYALSKGIKMNVDALHDLVVSATIALRVPHEFRTNFLPAWKAAREFGMNGHQAFIFASNIKVCDNNKGQFALTNGGHHCVTMTWGFKKTVNAFENGFDVKRMRDWKTRQGTRDYKVTAIVDEIYGDKADSLRKVFEGLDGVTHKDGQFGLREYGIQDMKKFMASFVKRWNDEIQQQA